MVRCGEGESLDRQGQTAQIELDTCRVSDDTEALLKRPERPACEPGLDEHCRPDDDNEPAC